MAAEHPGHSSDRPANRLAHESSPYLLQHAHNPVDWFPWGEEALARAKSENKPIFLSIGYSACHWCHVMERESFENDEIAAFLNEHFVCVKVDREERPDIDDIYMQAVQAMTGHGGWPMSVFLTPDLRPFFGGTYFPPDNRQGMPGFKSLIRQLADIYKREPERIEETAAELMRVLSEQEEVVAAPASGYEVTREVVTRAARGLEKRFDSVYGGFGPAPKFPPSMSLNLLMRERARSGEPQWLVMIERTLQKMARGGLFDQLGGGFHRYSVDHKWLVPHFEKMLYDNALLTPVYLDVHLITGSRFYADVARATLDYVLERMTDPEGGFYSAEDADSEGEEGKFYVWSLKEIRETLGDEADLFAEFYDVTEHGNFEGHNILNAPAPLEEFATRRAMNVDDLEARLAASRAKLKTIRERRVPPGKDTKVLAAWNGMMITAMARGAQVTGDPRYLMAAESAAAFVLKHMRAEDGGLLRTWGRRGKEGPAAAKINGFLEDYAFVIGGLIDLYETAFDPKCLEEAARLADLARAKFEDQNAGGFFTTDGADPSVLIRRKDTYDGATPSGNSAMTFALLRLALLLDRADLRESAMRSIAAMGVYLDRMPAAVHHLVCAIDFALGRPKEIAIIGSPDDESARTLIETAHRTWLPGRVLAAAPENNLEQGFNSRIALLKDKSQIDGKPTAYVCENYTCKQPVTEPKNLAKALE